MILGIVLIKNNNNSYYETVAHGNIYDLRTIDLSLSHKCFLDSLNNYKHFLYNI